MFDCAPLRRDTTGTPVAAFVCNFLSCLALPRGKFNHLVKSGTPDDRHPPGSSPSSSTRRLRPVACGNATPATGATRNPECAAELRLAEQAEGTGDALGRASDEVEASSFHFSDLDLERETTHAKANADAQSL